MLRHCAVWAARWEVVVMPQPKPWSWYYCRLAKRRRRRQHWEVQFGITEKGKATNVFRGWHAFLWWGRVSMEVVLVVRRIFGGRKNDMWWPNFGTYSRSYQLSFATFGKVKSMLIFKVYVGIRQKNICFWQVSCLKVGTIPRKLLKNLMRGTCHMDGRRTDSFALETCANHPYDRPISSNFHFRRHPLRRAWLPYFSIASVWLEIKIEVKSKWIFCHAWSCAKKSQKWQLNECLQNKGFAIKNWSKPHIVWPLWTSHAASPSAAGFFGHKTFYLLVVPVTNRYLTSTMLKLVKVVNSVRLCLSQVAHLVEHPLKYIPPYF